MLESLLQSEQESWYEKHHNIKMQLSSSGASNAEEGWLAKSKLSASLSLRRCRCRDCPLRSGTCGDRGAFRVWSTKVIAHLKEVAWAQEPSAASAASAATSAASAAQMAWWATTCQDEDSAQSHLSEVCKAWHLHASKAESWYKLMQVDGWCG